MTWHSILHIMKTLTKAGKYMHEQSGGDLLACAKCMVGNISITLTCKHHRQGWVQDSVQTFKVAEYDLHSSPENC